MSMPGFTAEASLCKTNGRYRGRSHGSGRPGVVPQQFHSPVIDLLATCGPCPYGTICKCEFQFTPSLSYYCYCGKLNSVIAEQAP